MRAVAVFMMIQGHSIDALLSQDYYSSDSFLFMLWQFGRGLTAPIFLFGSGFAYVLASRRKAIDGKLPASVLFKRVRWIAVLFLIGMLMHIPSATLDGLQQASPEQWSHFFQVDVLRLMAVTLLGLLVVLITAKNLTSLFRTSAIITLAIVLLSPLMYAIPWKSFAHESIVGYLSMETGSFFPIFPFGAYLFAGAATASLHLQWKEAGREHVFLKNLSLGAFAFLAIPNLLFMTMHVQGSFDGSSPLLFSSRLGMVMLLWVVVGLLLRRVNSLPAILPRIGQHTLLIYVSHVVVLYGCAWFPGIRQLYGKEFELSPVLGIIVLIVGASALLAWTMHFAKTHRISYYRLAPYAAMVLLTVFSLVA